MSLVSSRIDPVRRKCPRSAHTVGMSAMCVIPTWVVPTDAQVVDAHRISHAVAVDGQKRWQARAATLDWVTGAQHLSPVTGRYRDASEAVVRSEMFVADCVVARGDMAPEMWEKLGVPPAVPITDDREWADAVAGIVGWLLGTRACPVRLPRRHPDGALWTAADLLAEKRSGRYFLEPEDLAAMRTEAHVEAEVFRRLDELAASA